MTEPFLPDGTQPDPALAALLESPEFLAQMAALQAQALAQLEALLAAMRTVEGQLPPPPPPPEVEPPDHQPWDGGPVGISLPPPEPNFVPPPKSAVGHNDGGGFGMEWQPVPREMTGLPPLVPTIDDLAIDMLAVLPAIAVAPPAVTAPAAPSAPPDEPWQWTWPANDGNAGEGGLV